MATYYLCSGFGLEHRKDGKKEFVSIYDGRVWKATKNGFELIEEYI